MAKSPRSGPGLSRRSFLRTSTVAGTLAGAHAALPSSRLAAATHAPKVLRGSRDPIDLTIGKTAVSWGGQTGTAVTINGTLPGPQIRYREGEEAILRVHNTLDEDTSIHWHGLILPNDMDGVPGVNFPGIRPGETFEYRFPIQQYGTYWFHSHSGLQEQLGHYGSFIIDPAGTDPVAFDREYVIILSDWTFEDPYRLLAKLKKQPDYYNRQQRTLFDFFRDVGDHGLGDAISNRAMWGQMRMNPTDISDVTGTTYTFLMNGADSAQNWTGLFEPGERVRLRFINAGAASYFDVRIPGLPMEVVQVSGQHVKPVRVEEIRMALAETYDVIVEPQDAAYTVYAEAMDRSGFVRGTLAAEEGLEAEVPDRRTRPLLTMADMGMDHGEMDHAAMGHGDMDPGAMGSSDAADPMDHAAMGHAPPADSAQATMGMPDEAPMDQAAMGHDVDEAVGHTPGMLPPDENHGPDHHGPGSAGVAEVATSRLHEPGSGLGEDGRRVLVYTDLEALEPAHHLESPTREIVLHLTGNMERFMWSINGVKFSDAEPIHVGLGERFRLIMINDTMMNHPMHLHGMWMELENGKGTAIPRIHTLNVKPAEKVSLLATPDIPGPWAFHCHVLYHMDAGMFRVFHVMEGEAHAEHHTESGS